MKIYVASSWRNSYQPTVVERLRKEGHEVYDFRNPGPENYGFHWSTIDPAWKEWAPAEFRAGLHHQVAEDGFRMDEAAMRWANAFVLVSPCGRSAHLELGWAIGAGKFTAILLDDGEPELMYKLAARICLDLDEVVDALEEQECPNCEDGAIYTDDQGGGYSCDCPAGQALEHRSAEPAEPEQEG